MHNYHSLLPFITPQSTFATGSDFICVCPLFLTKPVPCCLTDDVLLFFIPPIFLNPTIQHPLYVLVVFLLLGSMVIGDDRMNSEIKIRHQKANTLIYQC